RRVGRRGRCARRRRCGSAQRGRRGGRRVVVGVGCGALWGRWSHWFFACVSALKYQDCVSVSWPLVTKRTGEARARPTWERVLAIGARVGALAVRALRQKIRRVLGRVKVSSRVAGAGCSWSTGGFGVRAFVARRLDEVADRRVVLVARVLEEPVLV